MSVPLDRLYNYLQDVVNHDILIYRWHPHGSKKLEDLIHLNNTDLVDEVTLPAMICHDQEPLDYHQFDPVFEQAIFDLDVLELPSDLHQYFNTVVSNHNLRLVNFTNIHNKMILLHSEMNSTQVEIYKQNSFLPVYYWSHGIISCDWFRYAKHDPALASRSPKTMFLIYNRAWSGTREYRLTFADMIVKNKLAPMCHMGFAPIDNAQHYSCHEFKNPALRIISTDLDHHFFKNNTTSNASADYCASDYQTTQIEVVLETLFDDTRWHLTEKILRPIACGHPFILAATSGSLLYLKRYGFETFNGLIDETYDTIEDPVLRLRAIVVEMKKLSNVDPAVWEQLRIIAARNKKRFFSDEFQKQIIDEYLQNLKSAIHVAQQDTSTERWDKFCQFVQNYHTLDKTHIIDDYMLNYFPFADNTSLTSESSIAHALPSFDAVNDFIKTLK